MPPASAPVMAIDADVEVVGVAGGVRARVGASGAAASTVQVAVAAAPAFPAASTRRTRKVTDPSESGPIGPGLAHPDHAPASSWHS